MDYRFCMVSIIDFLIRRYKSCKTLRDVVEYYTSIYKSILCRGFLSVMREETMKKCLWIVGLILIAASVYPQSYENNAQAYVEYTRANEYYRARDIANAKMKYMEVIQKYPGSKYVPFALYMLSFIETDYLKVIDYLTYIKNKYSDFKYWDSAMEKLGDIYYVIGNYNNAIEAYQMAKTDRAYYMLGLINIADGKLDTAIGYLKEMMSKTKDYTLAYKGFLAISEAYIGLKRYETSISVLQEAVKLKKWADDAGARLIFLAGKSYFYQRMFSESFYIFSILRTTFPLSTESSLAKNYLTYLEKHNIITSKPVDWIQASYAVAATLPFRDENSSLEYDMEKEAEKKVEQMENIAGGVVKSDVQEYIVRVGEYRELSVANLVATDLSRKEYAYPIGIYFRDGKYYAEIRGVKTLDKAKEYAQKLIELGYNDTKVIEVVKVTEYGP